VEAAPNDLTRAASEEEARIGSLIKPSQPKSKPPHTSHPPITLTSTLTPTLTPTSHPLCGHTPGKFPGKKRALSRTVYVYNTCLDGFLECIGTRRARYLKATSCDQHSTARANVWSCGAVCAVHAWSFTRSRSRFLSSRWQCRPHTCSPALAGRRGLGRHLMRSSVICGPLRSRWRRRRVSTLDSRRRRQVAACGQPQVA